MFRRMLSHLQCAYEWESVCLLRLMFVTSCKGHVVLYAIERAVCAVVRLALCGQRIAFAFAVGLPGKRCALFACVSNCGQP